MAFLRELQKEVKQKNSLWSPLNTLKVVIFDIETTGFYPEKGDQIISIGAIRMTGHRLEEGEAFYSLVNPGTQLPQEITALTNIKNEDLRTAPTTAAVLIQFFKYVKSDLLVAHHASHEKAFMKKVTKDSLRTGFEHRIIDTSFLIRLSNPLIKSWPLEEICKENGIEVKDRHHALGDAKMAAQVWSRYLQEAEAKGYKNLREIYEYLAKNE